MSAKAKRLEFRPADATCNPYLAFSAMLMAGLDGIQKQIDPGDPLDRNIYELPAEEAAKIPTVPGSLEQALDALEKDHDFLLQGGVFTQDVIDTWIEFKRAEAAELRAELDAERGTRPDWASPFWRYDEATGFTAMERTTGWDGSIKAIMNARGETPRGVNPAEIAVPGPRYAAELRRRGFDLHEAMHRIPGEQARTPQT